MKKLFTLLALLACFMGAKAADWVQVYQIDYSQNTAFPFYVMGYVPEWIDGVMTDFGANYKYAEVKDDAEETSDVIVTTQGGVQYYRWTEGGGWHQYFIADGIPTQLDGAYKVVALVRASEAVSINVNMGWGWGDGQQTGASVSIPAGDEFTEVEWQYSGIGGASCNLVAQPGGATATIEWKSVTVYESQKAQRPITWQEWLTNDGNSIIPDVATESIWMGDAETPWADPDVKWNDQEKNYLICAWGKEREVNMNDDGGWDPFPATIEQEENGNHYFIVHGKAATTDGDAAAWDNQFWIQSPKEWKAGTQIKVSFKCKASKDVTVATQVHHQNPSDYLIWHACGDVSFTTEWKEFSNVMTIADDMAGTWSIAFQLNQNDKEAIDFYFDDLSWQTMVLDEGLFLAGANTVTGLEYDLDNAIPFEYDEDLEAMVATVGTRGDEGSWVNEVMVSTVRGNDAAFKSATLKPSGKIESDEDVWPDYTESSLAKIKLPAAGVWRVAVDTDNKQMNFLQLEGDEIGELPEINPNPTEIVVNGKERDDMADGEENGQVVIKEEEGGTGQPWDNQFWIVANRTLSTGEATIIQFKYKSTVPAAVSTQCHADPGNYLHWGAIGTLNFEEDWKDFETTFTVPSEANNMKSIAFNMAEIRGANTYEIKDVVWKTEDETESLINQTGAENFYVKEGTGDTPHVFGSSVEVPTSINNVVSNNVPTVTFNLAGQRVNKDYKGIVIKNGEKYIVK